jgi:glycosyltransferase involved in cell wall biosynthesis
LSNGGRKPDVSVVVVIHDMAREAPRTLISLSGAYQRHIGTDEYEVIVVDNGSKPHFDARSLSGLTGNFRLIRVDPAPPSPVHAVNRGVAEARGDVIGVMIDGARFVTPGLLHFARQGVRLYDRAVVATLGWELGADLQRYAAKSGYDAAREDALLASIDWPSDGYRLFDVATIESSDGWLKPMGESNALFLRRDMWDALGGMDEHFDLPGGGFANLDLYRRALEYPGAELVILLGEATFHQLHGGISTNNDDRDRWFDALHHWHNQYRRLRGQIFDPPQWRNPPTYLGQLRRTELAALVHAALHPMRGQITRHMNEPALGRSFDPALWSFSPPIRPRDPTTAALTELAQQEFSAGRFEACAAIARLARQRAPEEAEPQRLLKLTGPWHVFDTPPRAQRAEFLNAIAKAHRMLDMDAAAALPHERQNSDTDRSGDI